MKTKLLVDARQGLSQVGLTFLKGMEIERFTKLKSVLMRSAEKLSIYDSSVNTILKSYGKDSISFKDPEFAEVGRLLQELGEQDIDIVFDPLITREEMFKLEVSAFDQIALEKIGIVKGDVKNEQ